MIIMYDDGLLVVFCALVHRPSSMCMYIVASKWVYTRWCLKRQLIKVSVISTQHWIIRRVRWISISRYNMKSFPSDNRITACWMDWLRQSYERREVAEICWINGEDNPADAFSKGAPNHAPEQWVNNIEITVRMQGFVQRSDHKPQMAG